MKTLQKKLFKAFIGVIAVGTSFAQVLPFVVETEPEPVPTVKQYFPYRFAVRTTFLYDVVLLPTLGVEWRITPKVGVKVDCSFAFWGNEIGYQLRLSSNLSIDFNLGLGYTYFKYNTFIVSVGIRVPVGEENRTANLWEPSQAGVSLIWTIGGK